MYPRRCCFLAGLIFFSGFESNAGSPSLKAPLELCRVSARSHSLHSIAEASRSVSVSPVKKNALRHVDVFDYYGDLRRAVRTRTTEDGRRFGMRTGRGEDDYRKLFSGLAGFSRALARMGPEDEIIDIGAGAGEFSRDVLERRRKLGTSKGLPRFTLLDVASDATTLPKLRAEFPDQVRLLTGQFFERTPVHAFRRAPGRRLWLDVHAAASYGPYFDDTLRHYGAAMSPSDDLFVAMYEERTAIRAQSGRTIGLVPWVKRLKGLKLVGTDVIQDFDQQLRVLHLRRTAESLEVPWLETEKFFVNTPPHREFKSGAAPALR